MDEERKEAIVGRVLVGGLIAAGVGLVLTFMLYFSAMAALLERQDASLWAIRAIGPILFLGGLLAAGGALLYGIREGKQITSGKGEVYADAGAKVLARYAYDGSGEMVTDEWLFDLREGLQFFVKLELTGGAHREFHCSRQVYDSCGEGMRGTATFDGKWLGGFVPQIGGGQASPWRPKV